MIKLYVRLRGIFDKSYMKQFMELKDLPSRYDMPSKFDLLYTKKNSFLINVIINH